MLGSAGAAAADGGGPLPADAGGGFASLIERAKAAHHAEVEELRLEVLGLRRELLAVRGQLDGQRVDSARLDSSLAEGPKEGQDVPAGGLEWVVSPGSTSGPDAQGSRGADGSGRSTSKVSSLLQGRPPASEGSVPPRQVSGGSLGSRRVQSRDQLIRQKGHLWSLVSSPAFEVTMAAFILANATVLALEAQYKGFGLASSTGYASAAGEPAEVWPLAEDAFDVLSWTFGVMFSLELFLRIVGLRCDFVKDAWNWLDSLIVSVWLTSVLFELDGNLQFLRVVRLARLMRLARIIKVLKRYRSDGLFMMATALSGSISSSTWYFLFLITVHALMALALNQFLHEAYFDLGSSDAHDQVMMYQYFGSFSRAFLTMLEITFGNWLIPVRLLVEDVDEWFILYGLAHKLIIGFAVVGVINALFVQETFKAAALDDNLMVRQQQTRQRHHRTKMSQLFAEADLDRNGTLDMDEWMAVCRDEWVQAWLESQDINAADARTLFALIDDGDGKLTADEVVKGTASLKGTSAIMRILTTMKNIDDRVKDIRAELLFSQPSVAAERMHPDGDEWTQ